MGMVIARWSNSEDDGIYWVEDDAMLPSGEPEPDSTLHAVMLRYLTTGETMEILKYEPRVDVSMPKAADGLVASKCWDARRETLIDTLRPVREAHDQEGG
jgi:hypothetical protein